ncbi:MAG: oxygenase MpaB family protein [Candidatus Nanopelagicales bacterium]
MSTTVPSSPRGPLDVARERVSAGFRRIVSGDPSGQPDWVRALADGADEGYFGPGSAAWTVHGSLPTLVGGVRALLMQALHPVALAGVREHSRYEQDPLGRLAGTTRWLTVTTFGDRAAAERESARVRGLHRKVRGSFEGAPYAASDPDLLRWVHVAFTDSFLATHRVWGGPIPGGEDAYVREWATAAELVGVVDPPRSVAELDAALAGFDPVLRGDDATRDTVRFIRDAPLPLAARPPYAVLVAGAVSTLRPHHREVLGLPPVPARLARPAVRAMLAGLAAALGPQSPSQRAARDRIARLPAESPGVATP